MPEHSRQRTAHPGPFTSMIRSLPPSQGRALRRNLWFLGIILSTLVLLTLVDCDPR